MIDSLIKSIRQFLNPRNTKYYKQIYTEDDIKESHSNKYIYNRIKTSLKHETPKISHLPISPLDNSNFEQINPRKLKANFGKVRAKFDVSLGKRKVNIYIYKNMYAGFKTTITAHFYKKNIFNLRYEFKVKDKNDSIEIANLIGLKYLNGEAIDIESEYLIDENNVALSFTNEFSLILNYHNDSEIFSYIGYLVEIDDADKQNQVYNRYKKLYKKL